MISSNSKSTNDTNEWYVFHDEQNEQVGPMTKKVLQKMYRRKQIKKSSLVWNPHLHASWIEIGSDPKLLRSLKKKKRRTAPGIPAVLQQLDKQKSTKSLVHKFSTEQLKGLQSQPKPKPKPQTPPRPARGTTERTKTTSTSAPTAPSPDKLSHRLSAEESTPTPNTNTTPPTTPTQLTYRIPRRSVSLAARRSSLRKANKAKVKNTDTTIINTNINTNKLNLKKLWENVASTLELVLSKDLEDDANFDILCQALDEFKDINGIHIKEAAPSAWHLKLYETASTAFIEWREYRLSPQLEFALTNMEREDLRTVAEECVKYHYTATSDSRVERILELINLSDTELLKQQYQTAKALGHTSRAIDREIKLKESQLVVHGRSFRWQDCPNLRDRNDYAAAEFMTLNRQALADGMCYFMKKALPTSLTLLHHDRNLIKTAMQMFKSIQSYMGDRKLSSSSQTREHEAATVISICQGVPELRIEVFVQLQKQLTRNPTASSRRRGFDLLAICLSFFGPPSSYENYLQMFVRRNAPSPFLFIGKIYQRCYESDKRLACPPSEVRSILNEFKSGASAELYCRHCPGDVNY